LNEEIKQMAEHGMGPAANDALWRCELKFCLTVQDRQATQSLSAAKGAAETDRAPRMGDRNVLFRV
jgi:hypothetical protein